MIVFTALKVCEHVGNLCKRHIATVDTVSIPYTLAGENAFRDRANIVVILLILVVKVMECIVAGIVICSRRKLKCVMISVSHRQGTTQYLLGLHVSHSISCPGVVLSRVWFTKLGQWTIVWTGQSGRECTSLVCCLLLSQEWLFTVLVC